MATDSKKVLIWTAIVGVLAVCGYAAYAYYQKKKEEEAAAQPKISVADAKSIGAGLGAFIKGLFTKAPVTTETSVSAATGKRILPARNTSGLIYPIK